MVYPYRQDLSEKSEALEILYKNFYISVISKNNFKGLYVLYVRPHLEYTSGISTSLKRLMKLNLFKNLHVNFVLETGI